MSTDSDTMPTVDIDQLIVKLQKAKIDFFDSNNKPRSGHSLDRVLREALSCLVDGKGWHPNDQLKTEVLLWSLREIGYHKMNYFASNTLESNQSYFGHNNSNRDRDDEDEGGEPCQHLAGNSSLFLSNNQEESEGEVTG